MTRSVLSFAAALVLAAGLGGPAAAQSNPCAPSAMNPCAATPSGGQPSATSGQSGQQAGSSAGSYANAYPQAVRGPAANPYDVPAGYTQAPYGDQMPAIVDNYLRAAPYVGTGGRIDMDSFDQLKDLGFKTVVSLVTKTDEEAEEVIRKGEAAGLDVINIPVATRAPKPSQVGRFAEIVNNPETYPVLVHCHSANRVGAMWALYRAANGVPPALAVQEGRVVGLKPSRESAVREQLGMSQLATN